MNSTFDSWGTLTFKLVSSSQNLDGSRENFSSQELATMNENPNLEINQDSKVVKFKYEKDFENNVKQLIENYFTQAKLLRDHLDSKRYLPPNERAEYFDNVTKLASEFYFEMISRHIFWDGAGRTSKLARDWMLIYLGLTPPLSTPRNDLTLTQEELLADLRSEVIKSSLVSSKPLLFDHHELVEAEIKNISKPKIESVSIKTCQKLFN